jgi:hypothetical protein
MIKLLSWNIAHRPNAWRTLIDADADIAMLQEACEPPADIASRFDVGTEPWFTAGAGARRPWRTAIVNLSSRVRLERIPSQTIAEARPGDLAVSRLGSLSAAHVEDSDTGLTHALVSMYAAWERPHASTGGSWIYADASAHRLISDISVLVGQERAHRIVAAGDLNVLHGYGENGNLYWAARYQTIFDRLSAIGLQFVGPQYPAGRPADPWPSELPLESRNVPTFHTNHQSPSSAARQLDFVFASKDIAPVVRARALNEPDGWGPSDHCRIAIELGWI